jgi:transcription termination factor Rho
VAAAAGRAAGAGAAAQHPDGGSLTVIATAAAPLGGETTVVALDAQLAALRPLPGARPGGERHAAAGALVGDAGSEAIARARADAAAGCPAASARRVRHPAQLGSGESSIGSSSRSGWT